MLHMRATFTENNFVIPEKDIEEVKRKDFQY